MKHPHWCNIAMYSAVSNLMHLAFCECLLSTSSFRSPVYVIIRTLYKNRSAYRNYI